MAVHRRGYSPRVLTVGVEEEFLLLDRDGHLSRNGPEVAEATTEPEGQLHPELARCQVESATGVCSDAAELVGQLRRLRERLAREAAARGLRLAPIASPLLPEPAPPVITPTRRYRHMAQSFGALARTGTTCGCHVHVAMPDRETAVRVANHSRPWLPVLLAVTANSPFHGGEDTGYCSWRHILWSRWPSSGPPPVFDSVDHYESLVEALLRTGAMLDRGMIYWDIRLSDKQPTLEFRVSDVAATAGEAALLGLLARGLAALALDNPAAPPPALPQEVLRGNLWRAARDGPLGCCLHPLTGELVPVLAQLDELVDLLAPVLRETAGDVEFAREGLARLRESGGGARRQRTAYARRGRLTDVVDLLAEN